MSPDPDFAWLEQIALSEGPPDEVVQAGGVAVVVRRRRPSLFNLMADARPRIERMGHDAIARAHAAGVPAWVSDGEGRIVRLDPDGTEHVETTSADEAAEAVRLSLSP